MKWMRTVIGPLLVMSAGAGGCFVLAMAKEEPARKETLSQATLVETTLIQPAPAHFNIRVHGTAAPKTEVNLAAEVSGKVIRCAESCEAGKFVTKGSFLLEIDPRRYRLEVKRLENELKQVKAEQSQLDVEQSNNDALISISESDLSIWQRDYERLKKLRQRNSASSSELDQAQSQLMKAQNALQSLRNAQKVVSARREQLQAQYDLTEARLDLAKLDLEKTTVNAPMDGVISEAPIEKDMFVQTGTLLAKIQDTSAIEISCNLRVEDLYWLWGGETPDKVEHPNQVVYQAPHATALIKYRLAGQEFAWRGFLSRYDGIGLDERTRTVPCRVEVPDPAKSLTPGAPPSLVEGMFVTVLLEATPRQKLYLVPLEALRPGNRIWCFRDGKLSILNVRVARAVEDGVLIYADGLDARPGDRVIISPLPSAVEGMPVRVDGEKGKIKKGLGTRDED